jgi:hypothetical protein
MLGKGGRVGRCCIGQKAMHLPAGSRTSWSSAVSQTCPLGLPEALLPPSNTHKEMRHHAKSFQSPDCISLGHMPTLDWSQLPEAALIGQAQSHAPPPDQMWQWAGSGFPDGNSHHRGGAACHAAISSSSCLRRD